MSGSTFWAMTSWVVFHACWIMSVARAARVPNLSPQEQVDVLVERAVRRMKRIERQRNPLTSWDSIL